MHIIREKKKKKLSRERERETKQTDLKETQEYSSLLFKIDSLYTIDF